MVTPDFIAKTITLGPILQMSELIKLFREIIPVTPNVPPFPHKQLAEQTTVGEPGPVQTELGCVEHPTIIDQPVGIFLVRNTKQPAHQWFPVCIPWYVFVRYKYTHSGI